MKSFFTAFGFFTVFGVGLVSHLGAASAGDSRLEQLSKITKTMAVVEKYYVDDLNFTDISNKTISGLLSNLDAHSSYLDERAFKDMQIATSGEFGGLGITIGMKDGAVSVIAPIDDTPADKAGIKAGDVILRIDGQSTIGMSIDDAVNKMRGKPKTGVDITIVRKGEKKPLEFHIIRDTIKVQSVSAKLVPSENILYLRVSTFDANVEKKAREFIEKNKSVRGIVLDLRNNPGGLLNQAVGLTNLFVSDGVIVSQKGRDESNNEAHKADPKKKVTDLPLAVLINEGSASASEIVSGALQDFKRAVVIGQKSFGKGSVQVVMPVDDKEAIRLTVARYYLPSGRTIQAVGVEPDVVVYAGKVPNEENNLILKESDLKAHLQSELEKIEGKKESKNDDRNIITAAQIYEDIQLKTAIDSVKIIEKISQKGEQK